jgi:hypothetical protein
LFAGLREPVYALLVIAAVDGVFEVVGFFRRKEQGRPLGEEANKGKFVVFETRR